MAHDGATRNKNCPSAVSSSDDAVLLPEVYRSDGTVPPKHGAWSHFEMCTVLRISNSELQRLVNFIHRELKNDPTLLSFGGNSTRVNYTRIHEKISKDSEMSRLVSGARWRSHFMANGKLFAPESKRAVEMLTDNAVGHIKGSKKGQRPSVERYQAKAAPIISSTVPAKRPIVKRDSTEAPESRPVKAARMVDAYFQQKYSPEGDDTLLPGNPLPLDLLCIRARNDLTQQTQTWTYIQLVAKSHDKQNLLLSHFEWSRFLYELHTCLGYNSNFHTIWWYNKFEKRIVSVISDRDWYVALNTMRVTSSSLNIEFAFGNKAWVQANKQPNLLQDLPAGETPALSVAAAKLAQLREVVRNNKASREPAVRSATADADAAGLGSLLRTKSHSV